MCCVGRFEIVSRFWIISTYRNELARQRSHFNKITHHHHRLLQKLYSPLTETMTLNILRIFISVTILLDGLNLCAVHSAGRSINSDLFVNILIMVIFEILFKFCQNFIFILIYFESI